MNNTPTREHYKMDNDNQVFFYEQEFYVLSNFSAFSIEYLGLVFSTSEHLYHAHKFFPEEGFTSIKEIVLQNNKHEKLNTQFKIYYARSAHDAYKLGQENKEYRRKDWDEVKVGIMKDILIMKVQQHPYVLQKLLETGDRELIEDSWRDPYWGWGPNKDGLNMLGKLWMEVREMFKNQPSAE